MDCVGVAAGADDGGAVVVCATAAAANSRTALESGERAGESMVKGCFGLTSSGREELG